MSTTTLDLGPVRPVHKGAYSATATYELLNIVSYNGGSWMMTASSYTAGTTPVAGATWALMAAKGDAGTNGTNGSDATVPAASTTVAGKVQLSSAINSTATNLASTPSAVKQAYDRGSLGVTDAATAQTTANTANTKANAALPKAGGTMTGGVTGTTGVFNTSLATPTIILDGWTITVDD